MVSKSHDLAISPVLRQELLQISTFVIRPVDATLFRRGDPCVGLYLILSGRVRLFLEPPTPTFPDRFLGPGSVVGLPATVAGENYSLTAVVVEKAELACVSRPKLTECLRKSPELCFEVMQILSREVSATRSAMKRISESAKTPTRRPSTV